MILYNLFPLLAGPFDQWQPHLERAAAMAFDWVFVNPLHRTGGSRSLYSVADYFALDDRFVSRKSTRTPDDQLRDALAKGKTLGLRFMCDLVVNHTASDSPLIAQHPEWYKMENGRVVNPGAVEDGHRIVWGDLAQLDHQRSRDRAGLYEYVRKVVEHLIGLGFDGFRCDAAYQLPRDTWKRLIDDTRRAHPDVVFSAETLGCTADETRQTASAGFDYIFNSSKWWNFDEPWLLEQYNLTREHVASISFPESHDTRRLADETGGNVDAMKQRYLFSALFSGGVMMPMGFEYGFRKKLHVVETTPEDWEEPSMDLTDFIGRTNRVKRDHALFNEDCATNVLPYHENSRVLVLWKGSTRSREEALLILNKDAHQRAWFRVDSLRRLVQSGAPMACVSPENPLEYLHQPFEYDIRPGEGIVVVAQR